jgi:hypothetical protein
VTSTGPIFPSSRLPVCATRPAVMANPPSR